MYVGMSSLLLQEATFTGIGRPTERVVTTPPEAQKHACSKQRVGDVLLGKAHTQCSIKAPKAFLTKGTEVLSTLI